MNNQRSDIQQPKPLGKQLFAENDIPTGIQSAGQSKLPEGAKVMPAREDGGYKGKVIYANANYIVQAVGAKQENAVVHRKIDVQVMGQRLEWREKNGMLNNVQIQVHYKGAQGKVYVWNQERDAAMREARNGHAEPAKRTPDRTPVKGTNVQKPAEAERALTPPGTEPAQARGLKKRVPSKNDKAAEIER